MTPIRIDIWSDVACPWCYLGKHRLDAALQQFRADPDAPEVEVVYHSYQLSPDTPADFDGSHRDYLRAKLGWSDAQLAESSDRIRGFGEELGLTFNFDRTRVANTGAAHQLLHHALQQGRQEPVAEALFKAYFTDGAHIGTLETLANIAEDQGLDRSETLRALQDGTHLEAVGHDQDQAQQIGVRGVPFFVLDRKYGVSGAQTPEVLLQALQAVQAERAA